MIVNINAKWRIRCDDYNYILESRRTDRGKATWRARGYYHELTPVLKAALNILLRDEGNHTPESLLAALAAISTRLEAIGEQCLRLWGKRYQKRESGDAAASNACSPARNA